MKNKSRRWLIFIIITLLLDVVTIILLEKVICIGFVLSDSMEPTLIVDSRIVGDRLYKEYKRGDIVSFYYPDNKEEIYIKRIIGIPGDTVLLQKEKVYVNGKELKEKYIKEPMNNDIMEEYHVPEGCYFVLGDNRNNSEDARYWNNTYVKESDIICKVNYILFNKDSLFKGVN